MAAALGPLSLATGSLPRSRDVSMALGRPPSCMVCERIASSLTSLHPARRCPGGSVLACNVDAGAMSRRVSEQELSGFQYEPLPRWGRWAPGRPGVWGVGVHGALHRSPCSASGRSSDPHARAVGHAPRAALHHASLPYLVNTLPAPPPRRRPAPTACPRMWALGLIRPRAAWPPLSSWAQRATSGQLCPTWTPSSAKCTGAWQGAVGGAVQAWLVRLPQRPTCICTPPTHTPNHRCAGTGTKRGSSTYWWGAC